MRYLLEQGARRVCKKGCRKCQLYSKLALRCSKRADQACANQTCACVELTSKEEEYIECVDFWEILEELRPIFKFKAIKRNGDIIEIRHKD